MKPITLGRPAHWTNDRIVWHTLGNGQEIPINTSRSGDPVFEWNAVYPPDGETIAPDFRDRVMANATEADDTYWFDHGPATYGHMSLLVSSYDEQQI